MKYFIISTLLTTTAIANLNIFGTFSLNKREFLACAKAPHQESCRQKIKTGCEMFCTTPLNPDVYNACHAVCKAKGEKEKEKDACEAKEVIER